MPKPSKDKPKTRIPRVQNLPFHQKKLKPMATYVLTYMVANGGQTPDIRQFQAPPDSLFGHVKWADADTILATGLLRDHMSHHFYAEEIIPRSEAEVANHTREMTDKEMEMKGLPWGINDERDYLKTQQRREHSIVVASRDHGYLQDVSKQIAAKEKEIFGDKRKTEIFLATLDGEIRKREAERVEHPDLGYLYAIRDDYSETKWAGG